VRREIECGAHPRFLRSAFSRKGWHGADAARKAGHPWQIDSSAPIWATFGNEGGQAMRKPRMVGMNHIAIEVGDIEEALAFYGRIFDFTLRGKGRTNAFIDMGDQFINLTQVSRQHRDSPRHFGLVVDDRSAVRELVKAAGGELLDGPFLDFLDPWGNRVEVVEYGDIQFTKAPHVMRGMGLTLDKTEKARRELAEKGMAPDVN
jgi:predicted enzyme related to lactoylglutathione lyase